MATWGGGNKWESGKEKLEQVEIGQLEDLTPIKINNKTTLCQRITVNLDIKIEENLGK